MTTAIDFPAALPVALQGTLKGGRSESWVADTSSVGSARRRNRYTRSLKSFSFTLRLTRAEFDTLDDFYVTTLDRGVLTFNWTHPKTAVSYEMFMDAAPQEEHFSVDYYNVSISLSEA